MAPLDMLAALDMGTNSFHLVVARVRNNGYDVVTTDKEMIRLGRGGGDMKQLAVEAMDRGIAALQRMQHIATSHGATMRAVATSAVREADNAAVFIDRAKAEAGVDVEVISGLEEARLIHLGVLQSVPAFDQRLLLVDIGGGSTEVLVGEQGRTLAARSFKLGAVRLTDRFFPSGITTNASVKACQSFARSILAGFEREVTELAPSIAIASSGTAETIAHLIHAKRAGPPLRTFNRFEFSRDELDAMTNRLARATTPTARLAAVRGLDAARADIIVAGAIVLQAVADTFGIETFTCSETALREGLLLDTIAQRAERDLHHLRDVSRQSIDALAVRCDDDLAHSRHVAALALELYDACADRYPLAAGSRDYLEAAALLANIGLVVSHSKHHLHSYYVIRNSELAGLTDAEIEVIAQIARYHRKSAPKASHPEFGRLTTQQQQVVRSLAAILRVAIGLDRRHDGRVATTSARVDADRIVIEARGAAGTDLSLEVYCAQERSGLLAEVTGVPVQVVAIELGETKGSP